MLRDTRTNGMWALCGIRCADAQGCTAEGRGGGAGFVCAAAHGEWRECNCEQARGERHNALGVSSVLWTRVE